MEGQTHTGDAAERVERGIDEEREEEINSAALRNAAAEQYMNNTASMDVFEKSRPAHGVNSSSDPFIKKVLPNAQQAILQEGDLMFMPPK